MQAPSQRDLSLDLLRGGAVLYIVGYYHIHDIWVVEIPGALGWWLARVALALFCFLSGYLLSGKTPIAEWRGVEEFYRRRLLKIYPLYLLALLGFLKWGLIEPALFWPSALLVNTLVNQPLLTLWFVSMIFLFYFVTPLFLWRPSLAKTCGLTLAGWFLLGSVKWHIGGIDPRLFPNLAAFALGIASTQSSGLRAAIFQPVFGVRVLACIVLGGLIAWQWNRMPDDTKVADMFFEMAWFVAALPWLFVVARWFTRFLPTRSIEFLATASFVLYLSHRLVYRWGESLWTSPTPLSRQFYYLLVLLPVALALSYFIQRLYQRMVR